MPTKRPRDPVLPLRLAATGRDAVAHQLEGEDPLPRRAEQIEAMNHAATLMDIDLLLTDAAWR